MKKRNNKLSIILIAIALLVGGYLLWPSSKDAPQSSKTEAEHGHGDTDEHGHDEHKDDHKEGGEHPHGDKDEHKEGKDSHDHNSGAPKAEQAKAEGGHGDEHGHEEGPTDKTEISETASKASGIVVSEAGAGAVKETLSLTGRINLNQNRTALIKARFPGIVRDVKKTQGETVNADDILATVESNESLQIYPVKSPISGVILSRNTNIGDVAADAPMFTVADISELWVELHVFPQDASRIKPGQEVTISSTECKDIQNTKITTLLPITEASSQTLLARSVINNIDNHWLPGMAVRGDVVLSSKEAPLVVKTSAIQKMEGEQVIFVQEGNNYLSRAVKFGASDPEWTEVLEGLKPGERYVSEGSFIVKADIGKAGAAHEH